MAPSISSTNTSISLVPAQHEGKPQIPQDWIYTMIVFGWIACPLILCIIAFAVYKHKQTPQKLRSFHIQKLAQLLFTLWSCNAIACAMWALCRTDLFITLNPTKCTAIYIINYLFYMLAKYFLHIALIYRLYIAFKNSEHRLQTRTIAALVLSISINFVVFSGLWLNTCIENVTIGITVPGYKLNVCTLFNSHADENMDAFHKIWPVLLGAQDLIIGLITLILFIYKMYHVSLNPFIQSKDKGMELVIRRLLICSIFAILSTFVFYTFAIPFYGNLTFLLPLDALINSFTVLLMISYGKQIYSVVCCGCDRGLARLMKSTAENEDKNTEMNSTVVSHTPDDTQTAESAHASHANETEEPTVNNQLRPVHNKFNEFEVEL
eukprot:39606_1